MRQERERNGEPAPGENRAAAPTPKTQHPTPHDGELVPGENLIIDGIPPIPAPLAEEVSRYTDFRAAALWSWHPAEREMLIGTRFGDTTQVHRVSFPGGARRQLTFFRDTVSSASYSPATADSFVFTKDRGGDEFYQTYRCDLADGRVTLLTDGTARNHHGTWSNAGDRMAYGSTRRNGTDVDLYVIQPDDPSTDRLLAELEGGGWSALDWSPDDRALLICEYMSINESYLWLFDAATGEKKRVTPKGGTEKVAYVGGQLSKDGKGIYVATDRGAEFRRLAYLDLATGQHTFLTSHIPWDVETLDLSPDGKRIALVTNEEGFSVLRLVALPTGQEMPAPRLPAGVISGLQWHRNGRDLGFNLASAHSPSDVYSLDVETGKVERWTFSETGGLNPEQFVEPELIHWQSFDGRRIPGFLYRPPARFDGRRPVVISIHGGPESQFRPGFMMRNNYLLNELGIAVICPNIRGSSGYGKTYLQLDDGFLREDSYKDIDTLLDWIETRPDLDAERILVTGASYGGHMTLAVATRCDDRIRCALDVVGTSNLVTLLENTASYRRDLRRAEYGDERDPEMRAFLERTAPLNHAHKITKPLFVVQGHNDPRVPRSESEQMVATLKKNATPVWYLVARDEGHGFVKKKNTDFLFCATVQFVKEFLLDG